MKSKSHLKLRALCEGAVMVALAQVLSYIKLFELPQGGSSFLPGFSGALSVGFLYSVYTHFPAACAAKKKSRPKKRQPCAFFGKCFASQPLYLRFLAASDFFFRFTLGFS